MGIPLSRVLLDFGAPTSFPATTSFPNAEVDAPMSFAPPCDPVDDVTRRIDEAYARGADEARLAADAEFEQKLAQVLARAEQERSADRARWVGEQAEELATRIVAAVQGLETRIAESVGRVLAPFLTTELRNRNVEALAESIKTLLSGGRPALRVSGPEDLLTALRERLGEGAIAIEWQPNGAGEVTVSSGDSLIETDIQSWTERLAGAHR
jgi:hypothetical protein